jgi:hypothetical protein
MESKVKFGLTIFFANLPFILIWMFYVATGFAFSPKEDVFNTYTFWGISCIYWFVFVGGILGAIWSEED